MKLRDLALGTPRVAADRRKVCIVDTIPGLRADLDSTIEDQQALPDNERHSIKTIFQLACQAYPELSQRLTYNGFWKFVTRTYDFHGNSR